MLGVTSKLLGQWRVWAVLGTFQAIYLVFLQLFEDVARQGDIKGEFIIIPFEAYAAIQISIPIFGELIFFIALMRWSMSS